MIILALGSNIGDRRAYLQDAVRRLAPMLRAMRLSRVFESQALLPADATAEMDLPFLNMAVSGEGDYTPHGLLAAIKHIECDMGRVARRVWGPREIDIDIVAMGETVLQAPELVIPHAGLMERDFVLLPVNDVAPDWQYPVAGPYYHKAPAEIIAAKNYRLGETLRDTGVALHA